MKTKIHQDDNGLYVRCDGWIARPPSGKMSPLNVGTKFKVGDAVRATHPAGPIVWVKPVDDTNRKSNNPNIEMWETERPYNMPKPTKSRDVQVGD